MARKEFTAVTGEIADGIALAYDDVKSIQYFGENIDCYYKKDGDTFYQMLGKAVRDAAGKVSALMGYGNS